MADNYFICKRDYFDFKKAKCEHITQVDGDFIPPLKSYTDAVIMLDRVKREYPIIEGVYYIEVQI